MPRSNSATLWAAITLAVPEIQPVAPVTNLSSARTDREANRFASQHCMHYPLDVKYHLLLTPTNHCIRVKDYIKSIFGEVWT